MGLRAWLITAFCIRPHLGEAVLHICLSAEVQFPILCAMDPHWGPKEPNVVSIVSQALSIHSYCVCVCGLQRCDWAATDLKAQQD